MAGFKIVDKDRKTCYMVVNRQVFFALKKWNLLEARFVAHMMFASRRVVRARRIG